MTGITTDYRGRAKPGPWYGLYYQDWNDRHPGAWVRGEWCLAASTAAISGAAPR